MKDVVIIWMPKGKPEKAIGKKYKPKTKQVSNKL